MHQFDHGPRENAVYDFGDRQLDLSLPHVMGVLNITPDSFSDGGQLMDAAGRVALDKVLARAEAMTEAGAAILDVGGESTRPGAEPVPLQEEMERVLPVVEAIAGNVDAIVSVDTSSPELIAQCREAGAGLINDVRALGRPGAPQAAAQSGLPVCLMHMQGTPADMQDAPVYRDVVADIREFLEARIEACRQAGIGRERLLIDPGFGFGKSLAHNTELLARLDEFAALGLPLLVGLSRKRMIGMLTGRESDTRMPGSIAAAVIAVMHGARIVRTHDVPATVDAIAVCRATLAQFQQ